LGTDQQKGHQNLATGTFARFQQGVMMISAAEHFHQSWCQDEDALIVVIVPSFDISNVVFGVAVARFRDIVGWEILHKTVN